MAHNLQANETVVSGDGFMLNVLAVLLKLSSQVRLDKVDTFYIFNERCRIDLSSETRLRCRPHELDAYQKFLSECVR